jgi:hypothetical protein
MNRVEDVESRRNHKQGDQKHRTVYDESEVGDIQILIKPFSGTSTPSSEPVQAETGHE